MTEIRAFCPYCQHNVSVDELYINEEKELYLTHYIKGAKQGHTWKVS